MINFDFLFTASSKMFVKFIIEIEHDVTIATRKSEFRNHCMNWLVLELFEFQILNIVWFCLKCFLSFVWFVVIICFIVWFFILKVVILVFKINSLWHCLILSWLYKRIFNLILLITLISCALIDIKSRRTYDIFNHQIIWCRWRKHNLFWFR